MVASSRSVISLFCVALTLGLCSGAAAQERLGAEQAVRLAVERSPAVQAARARLEAAQAGLRGARAPFNPQAELAPGVGFTNGNALLSQEIDIGRRRTAEARAAGGQRAAAAAALETARLRAAAEVRTVYYDLARARAAERSAAEVLSLTIQIRDAVRQRVEIGEAPQVQATRAEIEVARAEQEQVRAAGEVRGRLAALNVLLGRDPGAAVEPADPLVTPETPGDPGEWVARATAGRPELAQLRALVQAGRGQVQVARAERRPRLFGEFATDVWSLDRDPFQMRNLGFQARLSFPLFDRGQLRAGVDRAQAEVREQEAELAALTQGVEVEVRRAVADLEAARQAALQYERTILPQTEALLRSTRSGFETGLSSFLEVLEAQRLVRQTRTEYLTTLYEAVRARIALERAVGEVPGLAPMSNVGSGTGGEKR